MATYTGPEERDVYGTAQPEIDREVSLTSVPIQLATAEGVASTIGSDNLEKLRRRREAGEISQTDFDLNTLDYLVGDNTPLTRAELGNEALVLTRADFIQLGGLTITCKNGKTYELDPDNFFGEVLIIFPDDLG